MTNLNEMSIRTEEENEKLFNDESLRKMVLRANRHIDKDIILGLRGTKAIKLEDMSNTDIEYNNRESWGELLLSAHDRPMTAVDVSTWSSLIRNALDIIRPQLQYVLSTFGSDQFRAVYENCMNVIFADDMIRANSNFVKRLYKEAEETDLIKSTVYLNNKNHMLEIFTDEDGIKWYACAVYTGEIVWVLEALLDTIYAMYEDMSDENVHDKPHHTLVISYVSREDLIKDEADSVQEQIDVIDDELQKLELSKDLIGLQRKMAHINSLAMEIHCDIENIQKKYGLKTLDDLLK